MSYDVSYNVAKARHFSHLTDQLLSLCNTLPHHRSRRGRPVEFPLPALFVLLGLKFDLGIAYRDLVALVDLTPQLLARLGLNRAPHFSLLQKSLRRIDTRLLHNMYGLIARRRPPPRSLAVDSTGFSHSTGGEWVSVRLRERRRRRFHALHSAVDTDTLMVHATRVRSRPGGDPMFMVPLLRRVSTERLETVYADRAYITRANVQFVADVGAYPAIEPKRSSRINARSHRAYGQLLREYRESPEEWKRRHRYGRRSMAESVFSMMKVRHGGGLSSRGAGERLRDLLVRVVLHNIERLNYLECARRWFILQGPLHGLCAECHLLRHSGSKSDCVLRIQTAWNTRRSLSPAAKRIWNGLTLRSLSRTDIRSLLSGLENNVDVAVTLRYGGFSLVAKRHIMQRILVLSFKEYQKSEWRGEPVNASHGTVVDLNVRHALMG